MKTLNQTWSLFSKKQRYFVGLLLIAILFNAMLETISLGLILPLINLLDNIETVKNYPLIIRFADHLGLEDNRTILIYLFYLFITIFIIKTIFFLGLGYFRKVFIADAMNKLSKKLLRIYLSRPWAFHLNTNSAELENNIIIQVGAICTSYIAALLTFATEIVVGSCIVILLISIDPITTLVALICIILLTLVFFFVIRGKLENYGSLAEKTMTERIKIVNEAFGGIKETKILGRENYYIKLFEKKNLKYTQAWIWPTFIHMTLHSSIELVFVSGVFATSLYILNTGAETGYIFSILALFVAAASRLMPSINRLNSAIQEIKFHIPILSTIYDDITKSVANVKITEKDILPRPITPIFQKSIQLKNVSFNYPETKHNVLDDISIHIPKGCSVGFIGPSGAGKTTIIDIILGLLKPKSGKAMVDGKDIHENLSIWQKHIGYIPQNIFLSDNSIRKNVAIGLDDSQIDDNKVWVALNNAQLNEVVKKLPEGLDSKIGEGGLKISGGQRQRIGIARALYDDPEVLVLDEATSSLDSETEKGITDAINKLSLEKTLLIIAHRMTTVENCDIQFYLRDGKIEKTVRK